MTDVIEEIKRVIDKLQSEGLAIQMRNDNGVIRIYSEEADSLGKALSGLQDVTELAYTTAEHHPYWGVVYHATEICRILLEKWQDELNHEEVSEIEWRIEEMRSMIQRLNRD